MAPSAAPWQALNDGTGNIAWRPVRLTARSHDGGWLVFEYLGRSGHAGGYRIEVCGDRLRVCKEGAVVADYPAPPRNGVSIARLLSEAADARLGWGRLPTGDKVLALFDGDRRRHAFVVNPTDQALSGWGEFPAPLTSASVCGE